MKRTCRIVLIIFPLLLVLILWFMSNLKIAKTQDDLKNLLRQDLHLSEEDTIISYIDDYVVDDHALLWFSVQKEYSTDYRAMDCRLLKNGGYILKNIYKPMIYSQDIVHTMWMNGDIFLINDPDCRAITYRDSSHEIISKIELSPNDIPYVFLDKPPSGETKMDFLDSAGNIIR